MPTMTFRNFTGIAWLMLMPATLAGCSEVEHRNVAFGISPDGNEIVFSSADGDIFLFNLHGQSVRQVTSTPDVETTPCFSPDGKLILYSAAKPDNSEGSLFACQPDGGAVTRLTEDSNVLDVQPRYSRDGKDIVFARASRRRPYSMGGWTWDDWDVFVVAADGSNLRQITRGRYREIGHAVFAHDCKDIFYAAEVDDGGGLTRRLLEVDVAGKGEPSPVKLPQPSAGNHGALASEPDVSPSGDRLVIVSDALKSFSYDLTTLDLATGKCQSLGVTNISHYNQNPLFMPDGNHVLFLAGTESNAGSRAIFSLWSVNTDGTEPQKITGSDLFTNPISRLGK